MTISSHPDIATLMTCSAGSTPEALCAVVTSHLAMCPQCMNELTAMESIGVALFETLPAVDTEALAPRGAALLAVGDSVGQAPQIQSGGDVPGPLVEVIGNDLDALECQVLSPGIWHFVVPLTAHAKGDLRLVKLEAGSIFPSQGYHGDELVLVLRGNCRDGAELFGVGDFVELESSQNHSMVAQDDGCTLLIGSETVRVFASEFA